MPGAKDLPLEFQIVFWLLFIFIATLSALVVYFAKRYIDTQDKRFDAMELRFSREVDKIRAVTDSLSGVGITVKAEFLDFRKDISQAHEEIRRDTVSTRNDLSQALIRTITLKENVEKLEEKTQVFLKLADQANKNVTRLDQNQTKILTVLKVLSEKLILVSSKKQ